MRRSWLLWMASPMAVSAAIVACADKAEPLSAEEILPLPDRVEPDVSADGAGACPADLATDPLNCGACGNECLRGTNQEVACVASKCVTFCNPGFDDCDGDVSNGCEKPVSADSDNCGACGRKCAACGTAACTDGTCAPLSVATGQTDAHGITLSASHVYWTNRSYTTGSIRRMPKSGFLPAPQDVLVNVSLPTDVVVVDGTFAYYTLASSDGVRRVSLPGVYGPFPPFVADQDYPGGMVADSSGIYWTKNVSFSGAIMRCFNCGASALQVAGGLPSAGLLTLDGTSVIAKTGDAIITVDKTGANQKTLAILQQNVIALASDGATVFIARTSGGKGGTGEIAQVSKAGGDVTPIVGSLTPQGLALDGESLYFTTTAPDKALWRTDKTGKKTVRLARGLTSPRAIAVDATCAYFVDTDKILRVAK